MIDGQPGQEQVKTVKRTVTVPADVAEHIDAAPNRSAYVTAALRREMAVDQLKALFAQQGIVVDPARVIRLRERITAMEQARAARTSAA